MEDITLTMKKCSLIEMVSKTYRLLMAKKFKLDVTLSYFTLNIMLFSICLQDYRNGFLYL